MKQQGLTLRSRLKSFGFAFHGLYAFFKQEPNARIHLLATLAVFAAAYYFRISPAELVAIVIVTGLVWVAELFNTAIERTMDFISIEKNSSIGFIKDVSAGGVLLASITAILTGAIVFIPKLF